MLGSPATMQSRSHDTRCRDLRADTYLLDYQGGAMEAWRA